ncbi:hypothetical protein [Neolewinella agarilytica]|uniref:hypothetical protein n=1 Tax=Neolewinella agarilytica TaxID=478744 RepID=UPI002353463B|nr:hypothetical protein [Neolewinella agarilytica]
MGLIHSLITFTVADHDVAGHFFFQEQEVLAGFIRRVLRGDTFQEWVLRNR